MGKGEKKLNIPACAALILLTLTLITTHMTCGLYAKYTTSATASDSARVAKFDVQCSVSDDPVSSGEGAYLVQVQNLSEVAVTYSIIVEHSAPMSVTINGETKGPAANGTTTVTFSDPDWVLAPGESHEGNQGVRMTLSLTGWEGLTNGLSGIADNVEVGFKVYVKAVQLD